mgnify:CR=1 FL=1
MTAMRQLQSGLWPVWQGAAHQALRAMLGELEGLAITGGESSVRLSPGLIETGRWVAGFSPANVATDRMMGLPGRLGMPADGAAQFLAKWRTARQIYLSVEQAAEQVWAKVYWEYPLAAPDLVQRNPEQRRVDLQIESCKWAIGANPSRVRQTQYWRMSGLDGPGTVALLQQTQAVELARQALYKAVADVLQLALQSEPLWRGYRLLLVREPSHARHGVGLRFYGSGMRVNTAMKSLGNLFKAWGIDPGQYPEPQLAWAGQELGWLHAGLDNQSQPYLNVYGALSSADARAVLMPVGQARGKSRAVMQESFL